MWIWKGVWAEGIAAGILIEEVEEWSDFAGIQTIGMADCVDIKPLEFSSIDNVIR